MAPFLKINIKEKQKKKKKIQTSVNNTGNDLRHEIKFENCQKNKSNFLLSKTFLFFLEQKYIFSYSWKSSFYNS